MFFSNSVSSALYWDIYTSIGSIFTPVTLLHFILIYSDHRVISKKLFIILIYIPSIFFTTTTFLTPTLMTVSAKPVWWGYITIDGPLYLPLAFYNVIYVITSIVICYKFYKHEKTDKKRYQSRNIIVAILIPLIGGITTQIIFPIINIEFIPLTSTLTTFTAIIISFTIFKYELLTPKRIGYKRKITTSIMTLVLIIGMLTIIPSYVIGKNNAELNTGNSLEAEVQARTDHIITFINDIEDEIKHISEYGDILLFLSNNMTEKDEINLQKIKSNIINSVELHNGISHIEILNLKGIVVFSTDERYEGLNRSKQNIFTEGLKDLYIDDIVKCPIANKSSIRFGFPITQNNKTYGLINIFIDIENFYNILLKDSRLGDKVEFYLVNLDGLMVSPSKFVNNSIFNVRIEDEIYQRGFISVNSSLNNIKEEYENFLYITDYRGFEVIGTYNYIPELKVLILGEQDVSEALIDIYNLQNFLVFLFIFIIIIGFILSFFVSNILSKPIIELKKATEKIGEGNLDTKISIDTRDEIGDLASSFNKMVQNIKKARKKLEEYSYKLEKKVKFRTKELQHNYDRLERSRLSLLNMTYDFKDNIDELKDTREILETLNKELERKVEKRTEQIKNLLKQKDEFIDQLGHDLKNPLGPLLNLIPVLKKRDKKSENKEFFEIIERNVKYMKNLVVKTIELAKLNSPNTKLDFQNTNLLEEIENVIDQNKLLFEKNNIKIKNNISDKIMVSADKLRLKEVLNNLINNSVKYSKDSGKITLDAKDGYNFLTISIKDNGIGMTKEQISKIFIEFYKADLSRHDFDSSGLGMSITKRIIEKHGGHIWVESKGLGKGSTFYFTLPFSHKDTFSKS